MNSPCSSRDASSLNTACGLRRIALWLVTGNFSPVSLFFISKWSFSSCPSGKGISPSCNIINLWISTAGLLLFWGEDGPELDLPRGAAAAVWCGWGLNLENIISRWLGRCINSTKEQIPLSIEIDEQLAIWKLTYDPIGCGRISHGCLPSVWGSKFLTSVFPVEVREQGLNSRSS